MTTLVITGSHATPAEALIEQLPATVRLRRVGSPDSPKWKRYDWSSLADLVRLPRLIYKFKQELQLINADLVLSFGGYQAVPVCLAAKLLKIPIVIHEQTFGAGLASRLTALVAAKIAISWKSSRGYFPADKTVLTGNPIRQALVQVRRRPGNVLYFSGGGQGSEVLNRALKPILPRLLQQFTVYHAYGRQSPLLKHKNYLAKPYFSAPELANIYSRASLAIGRAGINTVTELSYWGLPALLVPLPYTQKNEQEKNAAYMDKLGLAVVLEQARLTPQSLFKTINLALAQLPRSGRTRYPHERVRRAAKNIYRLCSNWL